MNNYYRKKLIERYAKNTKRAVGSLYNQKFSDYFQSLYDSGEVPEPHQVTQKIEELLTNELRRRLLKSAENAVSLTDKQREFIMYAPIDELKRYAHQQR